jgi:hypothetical protein
MRGDTSSGGWRTWREHPPLWLVGAAGAVLLTVVRLGLDFLSEEQMEPQRLAVTAIVGLLFGVFVVVFGRFVLARNQAKPAGWPTAINLRNAVATGRLPEGANAEQWIPELAGIIRTEKPMYWGGPLFFGLFAALGVFLVFDDPAHPWFGGLFAGLCLSMAIWYPFWIVRRRARIEALIARFPEETAEDRPS